MLKVLFSAKPQAWDEYQAPLSDAFAKARLAVDLSRDHPPAQTDYIVFAPNGPVRDFAPYVNTKAVLSLWAGVETVADNLFHAKCIAVIVIITELAQCYSRNLL